MVEEKINGLNIEYRNITSGMNTNNTEDYLVEGYASTYNQKYLMSVKDGVNYYEMIKETAFNGVNIDDVIFQYNHDGNVLARTSNKTLQIKNERKGVKIIADLSKSVAAKNLYEEIKNGLITKMSIGFIVENDYFDTRTNTRVITKINKLIDVSAVSIPANNNTEISVKRYFNRVNELRNKPDEKEILRQKLLKELKINKMKNDIREMVSR